MNKIKLVLLIIYVCMVCISVEGQDNTKEGKIDCVTLQMFEQKLAPELKEKSASDVIVTTPDDLHLRFRLKNNCDQTIYYLSYAILDKDVPAGFMIYLDKENEWKTRTEGVRGEGSLTDPFLYHWVALKTGEKVEFEYSDLSIIEGERSLAIYVNYCPSQKKRIEILAEPFSVKKIEK
jgi:hypothetical protein